MLKKSSNKRIVSFLKKFHKETSGEVEEKFLTKAAKLISEEFNVDYVMIGLCDLPISEEGFFNSLCFFGHGKELKNLKYSLGKTPCIKILKEGIKVYIDNVQKEFPGDLGLKKMKIKSYISAPLQNSEQENIGLLTVMKQNEIEDAEFVVDVLDILATNIGLFISRTEELRKLKKQEHYFHRILECIGEGIILTDLKDRISYVNSNFCKITGFQREELIGKKFYETFLKGEIDKQEFCKKNDDTKKGISEIYEHKWQMNDKKFIWVEVISSPFFDESGKLVGTIGSVTEITERIQSKKLTELLYQISENANKVNDLYEFYKSVHSILGNLLNVKNFYIAVLDKETGLVSYPYFVDEKDEMPKPENLEGGLTEFILRTGESMLLYKNGFRKLKNEGKIKILGSVPESWIGVPLKLGKETFGVLSLQSYESESLYTKRDLEVLSFVAQNFADVIAHKRDDDLKRKKEKDYNFIFANSPIGIATTTLDGVISEANAAFCNLLNYSLDELKSKNIKDITHKDDIDKNFYLRTKIIEKNINTFQQQKRYITKDGKIIHTLLASFIIYDANKKPKNFIGFIVDISEIINVKSRNEAILNAIPDLVFLCNKFGKIVDFKANPKDLFVQPKDFLGKRINEIDFPAEVKKMISENIDLTINQKIPRIFEYKLMINDILRHYEARMSLTSENEITTIIRDITEAKFSRQVNEYRNNILEMIATDSSLGETLNFICEMVENILSKNVKSSIVLLNEDSETIQFCFSPSLPIGFTNQLIGKKIGQNAGSCGTAMFTGKTVIVNDIATDKLWENYRELAKEYSLKACWSKPIFSFEGSVIGSFAMYYNEIYEPQGTDLELVEEAAKLSEIAFGKWRSKLALNNEKSLLKVTLKSIGDGVITLNNSGKVVLINEIAEKIMGCLQKDAVGKYFLDVLLFMDSKNRELFERHFNDLVKLQTNTIFEKELKIVSPKKSEILIMTCLSPIKGKNEEVSGAVLVLRDVTEKKRIEDEIQRMSKLESIGLLAGGIAHDFNNMLTGITGNISLAKIFMQSENVKSIEKLEEAEKALIKAKQLTQQLLTFSKGGVPVKKIGSLRETILESVSFALRGANIKAEIDIAEDLWNLEYDEGQIDQALNNLVINASQSMPNGGIIKVVCKNVKIANDNSMPLKRGNYILIKVSDRGNGIPKEIQNKIFVPYFTTKEKGHGLGLATTYSIISKHEGYIKFETKEGKGTTFYIYLPSLEKFNKEIEQTTTSKATNSDSSYDLAGKKILIMDDDELVRGVIGNLFQMFDSSPLLASDGEEAIEIYKKESSENHKIDLVLTDLTVQGGMGGKDLINELLKIDPNVKAIVISGYYNDPVMANFEDFGFKGVIQKPFEMEDLISEVKRVLNDETVS